MFVRNWTETKAQIMIKGRKFNDYGACKGGLVVEGGFVEFVVL